MSELGKLTCEEARAFFGPRSIALLPIGSTEPHGPHLPLDTDVTIALAQARRAAARLGELGVPAFVLPPIAYGITRFTEGFAGRVTLRPGTLWALVEDIVLSLQQEGVLQIALVNGHLEPEHVQVLRGLALDHPERGKGRAQLLFPDNTRRRWAATLGDEFAGGDCHAGRYESSLVLAADPGAVREELRRSLPPHAVGLVEKMKSGARSFLEVGATRAYCGDPAAASAEEGERLVEQLAEVVVRTAREAWPELFA